MPNERASRLAAELQHRRQVGLARKKVRKRLPRQTPPKAIERDYAGTMLGMLSQVKESLQPLFEELPRLLRSAELDRQRYDAGEGRRIRELMEKARSTLAGTFTTRSIERIAEQFAQATAAHQRRQLAKQVQAALGVDVLTSDTGLVVAAEAFTAENVALIQDLPTKVLAEIEGVVQRGVQSGKLHKDLSAEIEDRFRISRNRAKLIARDQINKYYGKVQETRQRNMGVEKFIWRTVGDERVRDEHRGYAGKEYTWANAPEGGPGAAINCRCYAEPVFDFL